MYTYHIRSPDLSLSVESPEASKQLPRDHAIFFRVLEPFTSSLIEAPSSPPLHLVGFLGPRIVVVDFHRSSGSFLAYSLDGHVTSIV